MFFLPTFQVLPSSRGRLPPPSFRDASKRRTGNPEIRRIPFEIPGSVLRTAPE